MFKFCIWYTFNEIPFNKIILRNANLFNTSSFKAHITIKSDIRTENEAHLIAAKYAHIKPTFEVYGPPVQTHTKIANGIQLIDFYAIEQRLKINEFESPLHVSLAYSDKRFSDMEVGISNTDIPKYIYSKHLSVCVMNCWQHDPSQWYEVSKFNF